MHGQPIYRTFFLSLLALPVSIQAYGYTHEIIEERTASIPAETVILDIENEIITFERSKLAAQKTASIRVAARNVSQVASELSQKSPGAYLDTALLPQEKNPEDELFIDGWKAYQSGNEEKLVLVWNSIPKEHLLRDYLELWILTLKLRKNIDDNAISSEFLSFISKHHGSYLAERATTDYLLSLEENIEPSLFNSLYQTLIWNRSNPNIRAWYYFHNFSVNNLSEIKEFLRSENISGNTLACLLEKIKQKDPKWAWTAITLLLQKQQWKDVGNFIDTLPSGSLPASKTTLHSILRNPERWQTHYGKFLSSKPARLGIFLTLRLAPENPELACDTSEIFISRLGIQWQDLLNATLSYKLSVSLSPNALEYFKKIRTDLITNSLVANPTQIQEWAIKAALREENWFDVLEIILSLPKKIQNQDIWRYWRGRALFALDEKSAAEDFLIPLQSKNTYYGKLACDFLNKPYPSVDQNTQEFSRSKQINWDEIPSLQRAIAFYRMDLFGLGHREWNWVTKDFSDIDLIDLADYALRQKLIHRMINTSLRSGNYYVDLNQRFPTPQRKLFDILSTRQDIPISWIYGLIRQESRFMPTVSSTVGARGLMQIMPSTARWLALRLDLNDYEHDMLTELEMNLLLGTSYLRMLLSEFDGNLVLATASYNAGTMHVRRWRALLSENMPSDIFIECIPFYETREYVKNVMTNTHTYGTILNLQQPRFSEMLGIVSSPPLFINYDLP